MSAIAKFPFPSPPPKVEKPEDVPRGTPDESLVLSPSPSTELTSTPGMALSLVEMQKRAVLFRELRALRYSKTTEFAEAALQGGGYALAVLAVKYLIQRGDDDKKGPR